MRKTLAVVAFCSAAVACGSSGTVTTDQQPTTTTQPQSAPTTTSTLGVEPATSTHQEVRSLPLRLPPDPQAPTSDWVTGMNSAGWDFHQTLEGNAVSSPLSIGLAFSLARAGASPDTSAALDKIFGFPDEKLHWAANTVSLAVSNSSREPNVVEIANRLFPDDTFKPETEFVDVASQFYGAAAQPVDFSDPDTAALVINNWASEQTRGLIPKIVTPEIVRDQELVLANSVYLKADWQIPFEPLFTTKDEFYVNDTDTTTVDFMRNVEPETRRYTRLANADAVELPYKNGDLAMWIIVPHDREGLESVEAALTSDTFASLGDDAQTGLVDVAIPKWEQTLPATDLFRWLCPQGFCTGAEFDGIAPGLFVTSALHSAKVIVDEKGTEAAAVTAMGFDESAPPEPDLRIAADHPFLWAITHQDTGAMLFVGRLVAP